MSNDFIVQTNSRRENQRFFVNSTEVFGIQSVQGTYDSNGTPLKFLGMGVPVVVPNGKQAGAFNVSTMIIDTDKFLQFTGNSAFNGYILKSRTDTTQNFSFSSGYLTSYQSRCSIGEIPSTQVNIAVLGNVGNFPPGEESSSQVSNDFTSIAAGTSSLNPQIAGPGSISISLNDFTTNRVLSYDLAIDIGRHPYYPLGSRYPNAVEIDWPIGVTLGFQFAINNYAAMSLRQFPFNHKTADISVTLKSFDSNSTIVNYQFSGMYLAKESYSARTEGQTIVDATYKCFLGRPA